MDVTDDDTCDGYYGNHGNGDYGGNHDYGGNRDYGQPDRNPGEAYFVDIEQEKLSNNRRDNNSSPSNRGVSPPGNHGNDVDYDRDNAINSFRAASVNANVVDVSYASVCPLKRETDLR